MGAPTVLRRYAPAMRNEPLLEWPAWATWALLAVILTSLVTIYATINDIW